MDNKFLSYFQSGSKPESSNFDGSFQNLFTASFGGLTPVCVKPVLADDHWKINLNSEVKVNTLSAPAYTNIKQNFYSFFVSNQSVWKHWNSFITNGTDFQDVYGSNTSNQSIDNAWKIPSIPTNYLQFISKVSNGFAIPVFTIRATDFTTLSAFKSAFPALGRIFGWNETSDHSSSWFTFDVSSYNIFPRNSSSTRLDGSVLLNILLSTAGLSVDYSPTILSLLRVCPYISFVDRSYNIDSVQLTTNQAGENNGYFTFHSITFGLSLDDLPILLSILQDRDVNSLLPYSNPSVDFNVSDKFQFINFRFFENETSNKFDINESPFGVRSGSQSYYFGDVQLNTSRYYRKYTLNKKITQSNHYFNGVGTLNGYKVIQHDIYQLSESWAKELCVIKSLTSPYPESILLDATSLTTIPSTSPIYSNYIALFESDDFMPTFKLYNNCRYSSLSLSNSLHIIQQPLGNFQVSIPPSCNYNTFDDPRSTNIFTNSNSDGIVFKDFFDCDLILPFYCNSNEELVYSSYFRIFLYSNDDDSFNAFHSLDYIPLFDSSALATGCTTFTHFLYLMQNCCKTLDYFNIPFEGFTIRGFKSYANEFISALPFMCLSKIWDEYFRNRTVSSPELNFCEVNGLCYYPKQRKLYCSNVLQGDFEYFKNLPENGWVIPFDVLPKNSQFNFTFQNFNADLIVKGINNFHYFNVTTFADCLSLLSGFQLNHCLLRQIIVSIFKAPPSGSISESIFVYGALIDNFQLPNFYNGLLHYRYQNFSKDYFSSSLLDAMSGANQEVIPQNVTELRQAEARQSFWEQTAVARSVKKFFNKMFGTTPTHMEYDRPILLGQSHTDISVGEIIQTSETDNTPQGTRTGIAGSHDVQGVCNHGFNEQGWLIVLCSYTLESQYFQGLSKLLVPYKSFLDYPFRQFYHIGNQSINMREISYFSNPSHAVEFHPVVPSVFDDDSMNPYSNNSLAINPHRVTDSTPNLFPRSFNITPNYCINSSQDFNAVFGFIPRFSEYKFNQDELHGDFRNTLFSWNSFRKFHTLPYFTHNFVNWEFSGVQYDLNRLFAVQDDSDKFICSLFVNCQMHRQIPYYTVPKSL